MYQIIAERPGKCWPLNKCFIKELFLTVHWPLLKGLYQYKIY